MTTAKPAVTPAQLATIKRTVKEKLKHKAHAVGTDAELLETRKAALTNIKLLKDASKIKCAQATQLSEAVSELSKFEFVTSTMAATVLAHAKVLSSRGHKLEKLVTKLDEHHQQISGATGQDLSKPLGNYAMIEEDVINLVEELAGTLAELAHDVQKMLEVKAIEAWVHEHPDSATQVTRVLAKLSSGALAVATEGVPPEYRPVISTAMFLKDVIDVGIERIHEKRQTANYQKKNMKGQAFSYLDEEPTAMAKMVAAGWKTKIKLLLSAISIGGNELPSWATIIRPGIEMVANAYIDARVEKLADQLEKAKADPTRVKKSNLERFTDFVEDTAGDVKDDLIDKIEEKLPELVMKGIQVDNLKDGAIGVLTSVLQDVVKALIKHLPIDPAQEVNGEALRAEVAKIAHAGVFTQFHRVGQAQAREYERPTADKDGNPVDMIVSTAPETDDKGKFLWVRVGGKLGKLYLDSLEFDGTAKNDELAKIPTEDSRGRPIDEVRASMGAYEGVPHYEVRIDDVWGFLHPDTREFHPDRPDKYSDWTHRKIMYQQDGFTGYIEGGRRVEGHWYKAWPTKHVYIFLPPGGKREWAYGLSTTGNVEGSMEYSVEELLGKRVTEPYPWQL